MLDTGAHLRARRACRLLALCQRTIACGTPMDTALQAPRFQARFDLDRAVGAWRDRAHRPASDCRAQMRPSHPTCGSACAPCPRRGGSCSRRSSRRSSSSSARPYPSGHSWRAAACHPSGVLPALIVSFSSFVLRCLGTDTIGVNDLAAARNIALSLEMLAKALEQLVDQPGPAPTPRETARSWWHPAPGLRAPDRESA